MRWLVAALALALATLAFGQAEELAHPDAKVEQRLKALAEELRCLVCQNQTIADSNAALALDLRNQIRMQIAEGRSDAQIRDYMVERYGDFVLYRPPFKASTLALWLGPAALLVVGAFVFWGVVRRRPIAPAAASGPEDARRIEALLSEELPAGQAPPRSAKPRRK
jgi:cytochrome c-type biogenesis protein CcmH